MSQPTDRPTQGDPAPSPRARRPSRLKRWIVRLTVALGVVVLLGGGFVGVAEHYTAQPSFCASCHIMGSYYDTWMNDTHGGRLKVACIECHYAPGQRNTINAKLRGLSQVASYFSGRYGATRPRAHVAPESCMTAACHGDRAFMTKPLQIGTVTFTHEKHLLRPAEAEKASAERHSVLTKQLESRLGSEHLAALTAAAKEIGPIEERADALVRLCESWEAKVDRREMAEFIDFEHRPVRLAQLQSLQCVDCHANTIPQSLRLQADTVGQHHFSVQKSSCFTCHFNNQAFNTGTAECMKCHTPPQKAITVHEEVKKDVGDKLKTPELVKKAVKMDHSEIVARKVDCRSCHADVIFGDSVVTRRDCERCHDQPSFYADWKPTLTTDIVKSYHAVHVPNQHAKCLDCHSQIQHQLGAGGGKSDATGFLSATMTNCTHCHTNHHGDVMNLLLGHGGVTVPKSDPNMMFGARTNCYGCHTQQQKVKGRDVMVATQKACVACHGEQYVQTFEQWKQTMEMSLKDAQESYEKARKALADATGAPADARAKVEKLLNGAASDLALVQNGNGVHNITYAMQLLDGVSSRCGEALRALPAKK